MEMSSKSLRLEHVLNNCIKLGLNSIPVQYNMTTCANQRELEPDLCASSAEIGSPVKIISIASDLPTALGRR